MSEETVVNVDNKPVDDSQNYKAPEINMAEAIPPEFRDKPYFKDKTFVDVIKEHANLQTLLGQRPAGIPKDDASDEEWGRFLTSIRPKTVEEYAFPETEYSKAKGRNEDYMKAARGILFDANLNKRQAAKVLEGFEGMLLKASAMQDTKTAEQTQARESEFEALLDSTYKGEKQNVIDRTKRIMADAVAPDLKEKVTAVLKDISNEALFALTAVLEGVHNKYIKEDAPPGGGDGGSVDAASLQAEAEKIMQSPEYSDFRKAGHDQAKQRVQEIFGQIAKIQKSK